MRLIAVSMILLFAAAVPAQNIAKIADDTFDYIKAGTFGKPKVAKAATRFAVGQVRVHYKLITSKGAASRDNSAEVTVYLDTDLTNQDLQNLTDEFYAVLAAKLRAAGIDTVNFDEIKQTEYFLDRQRTQEDKKLSDADAKNGQAWVSFTAFDGPALMRWRPYGNPEPVGFGKVRKMADMSEKTNAEVVTFDIVLDFASIALKTDFKQQRDGWLYDGGKYTADYAIGPLMNVPESFIFMVDRKNNFDQYKSVQPVAARSLFAQKPYEDPSKAALRTRSLMGEARFTFTPLIIFSKRELYISAAREMLGLYADMFVEKLRVIRGESSAKTPTSASKSTDDTSLKQVDETARKNNEPTPVTTGELESAAVAAEREGKFRLAVDYYSELIKKDPANINYVLQRGRLYLNSLNDIKAAIRDFETGMKIDPKEPVFYFNRGTAYVKLEDWKKAKADFDKHISLNPNFADSYLNRGIAFIYLKNLDAALADFNRGIQLDPKKPNLYRARAIVYRAQGNAALAQADEIRAAQLQ